MIIKTNIIYLRLIMNLMIRLIAAFLLMGINISSFANSFDKERLKKELSNIPTKHRLRSIEDSVKANEGNTESIHYMTFMLDEAIYENDNDYTCNAFWHICRYYYLYNTDSLTNYMNLAEPYFIKTGRIEELLRIKGWNVFALTEKHKYKETMTQINHMRSLAKDLSYNKGGYYADFSLANFYINAGLREEGLEIYTRIFNSLSADHEMNKKIYILRQIIKREPSITKRIEYLNNLDKYIKICATLPNKRFDEVNTYDFLLFIYHGSFAYIEYERKEPVEMKKHMDIVKSLQEKYYWDKIPSSSDVFTFYYAILNDNYNDVISKGNYILDSYLKEGYLEDYLMALKVKGDYLAGKQNYEEAFNDYVKYTHMEDSLMRNKYYKSLAILRTQSDVDRLIIEKKRMELVAKSNHTYIFFLISFVVLLVITIALLSWIVKERNKNAIKLKAAKEKAEESDRMKSAFLANMNHEIRTPLNAIVGFSQILIDEEDQESRKEFGDIIINNNQLLQRIINDVLDISKIESNTMTFIYEEVEVIELLNEIYSIMYINIPPEVKLKVKEKSPVTIVTDRTRLTQIINNFVDNAIKHTSEGEITMGYKLINEEIEFFVADTGKGIEEDKLEAIFNRFTQLDNWKKGVGLGLAICKGLAIQLGGRIRVESKINKGSIFYVTLPKNKTHFN